MRKGIEADEFCIIMSPQLRFGPVELELIVGFSGSAVGTRSL